MTETIKHSQVETLISKQLEASPDEVVRPCGLRFDPRSSPLECQRASCFFTGREHSNESRQSLRTVQAAASVSGAILESTGYCTTHIFEIANEEEELYQYVETMDVETWEHITRAIDVMMIRTRTEGWTVGILVTQLDLPRRE
jgi:hypothetical protein